MPSSPWHLAVRGVASGARALSRTFGAGAGETVPGRVAMRLAPSLPSRIASSLAHGCVLVSGTNGKTTTTSLVRAFAAASGMRVAGNPSGSNLSSGVAAGLLRARDADIGIFEVDEAALPGAVRMVRPRVLVLLNVFRDQLDRYGEPERVRTLFADAIDALPQGAHVIVNADDPLIADLGEGRARITIGVDAPASRRPPASAEPDLCPRCAHLLEAASRTIGHYGVFACAACGWRSPARDVVVAIGGDHALGAATVTVGGARVQTEIGGVYNSYNIAAAIACADAIGIERAVTLATLPGFKPRFGRQEELTIGGRRVMITLAKNPGGADAIIAELSPANTAAVVFSVSDLAADGRDPSWIWDTDLEWLIESGIPIYAAGTRAEEVALRVAYGGGSARACVNDPADAVAAAVTEPRAGDICVLATYTSMIALRRTLFGGRANAYADDA